MTFSGCRAATRLLERRFILLDFKTYNVFLPMNDSTLKYNFFLPFSISGLVKMSQEVLTLHL